jgi:hypothetical protein
METSVSIQGTGRAGPRTPENAKEWMHDKLKKRVHRRGLTDPAATAGVIDQLERLDGAHWLETQLTNAAVRI